MQAVLGFVDGDAARRIHHRVGGLDVAAQRQAVAEDGIVGERHLRLVDDEVAVAVADGLLRGPAAEVRQRAPALGVDDVGAGIRGLDVVAHLQRTAAFGHVLRRPAHVALVEHVVRRRTQQGHVHAQSRGDGQRGIGDGGVERLRVVGPGQHVLLPAQVGRAEVLLQRLRVRQLLARMGDGLHVDDRHRGVLRERAQHLVLPVLGPVAELREGAHADHVHVAAKHARDFGDVLLGLAIHHRAQLELDRPGVLAGLQHDRVPAELERAQLEAGAGPQRGIEEHQRDGLAAQQRLVGDAGAAVALVAGGGGKQRVELGAAQVLGVEEVLHGRGSRRDPGGLRGPGNIKPSAGAGLFGGGAMRSGLPSGVRDLSARARGHPRRHAGGAQDDGVGAGGMHRARILAWRGGGRKRGADHLPASGTTGCRLNCTRRRLPGSYGRRERYFMPRYT